jgi:hypothetical protein
VLVMAVAVGCLGLTPPALAASQAGHPPRDAAAGQALLVTIRYRSLEAAVRAATPPGARPDSGAGVAAYLARTSRAFTARKGALLRRHRGVTVLARYRMLPVLLVRVRGSAAARSLAADHAVLGAVPVRIHRLAAVPEVTGPGLTERGLTERGLTEPGITGPGGTGPGVTEPGVTEPRVTEPRLTRSKRARPDGTPADLELINALAAQASGDRGAGTAVAVLDDGTDYHNPAFGTCPRPGAPGCSVLAYRDFAAPPRNGLSFSGHGTNVAGQVLKVAPDTRLVAGNIFHRNGQGASYSDAGLMRGLNWVLAEAARYSPAVSFRAVNMSLQDLFTYHADWCTGGPFTGAFSQLVAVGIQPVVAAGNDAYQGTTFRTGVALPACTPGGLAVGAVFDRGYGPVTVSQPGSRCADPSTRADEVTCFSQGGPLVGLLAPGWAEDAAGITDSGTSQASPLVAGAIAALASGAMTRPTRQIVTAMGLAGHPDQDPRTGLTVPRLDVWAAAQRLARG